MTTLEMGIRIDMEKGVAFFGVEEVNKAIAGGARVVEVRPGGAIFAEVGRDTANVSLTLTGCQYQVVLEP